MIHFTKMHGIGNDYLFLDAYGRPPLAERRDLPELAVRMSNRTEGVGADGIILIAPPTVSGRARGAGARMRMFNADGSEGEMCGNGVRCVAKYLVDRSLAPAPGGVVNIETGAGVLRIQTHAENGRVTGATVDMGEPILDVERVPADVSRLEQVGRRGAIAEWLVNDTLGLLVSMGNPHLVSFFDHCPGETYLQRIGPELERHPAFPNRMNVHLACVNSRRDVSMMTWERGSGQTRACGTGACAVLVAGALTDRCDREATIHLPGGDIDISWDHATNHVFMTGPAEEVFSGTWPST